MVDRRTRRLTLSTHPASPSEESGAGGDRRAPELDLTDLLLTPLISISPHASKRFPGFPLYPAGGASPWRVPPRPSRPPRPRSSWPTCPPAASSPRPSFPRIRSSFLLVPSLSLSLWECVRRCVILLVFFFFLGCGGLALIYVWLFCCPLNPSLSQFLE